MTPQNPYGWGLPLNISSIGGPLDNLFWIVHVFMALLFVGWGVFFVYCLVRFRARDGHKAVYETDTKHLNTYLEGGIVVFEIILIVFFSIPLWAGAKYKTPTPEESVNIEVVAEQFNWNVRYPGPDGKFGRKDPSLMHSGNPIGLDLEDPASKDDVISSNELWAPSGKPVLIKLSSTDVIHSFYLPVLRVKQDVVPGQSIDVWFNATDNGDFEIACAQLCGVAHYRMMGKLFLRPQAEFDAWLKEKGASAAAAKPAAVDADF
jgi:cytochrome c oxidase subunit 2